MVSLTALNLPDDNPVLVHTTTFVVGLTERSFLFSVFSNPVHSSGHVSGALFCEYICYIAKVNGLSVLAHLGFSKNFCDFDPKRNDVFQQGI